MASGDAPAWVEILRTVSAAASPVLVVAGWFFVNRQNNDRECRKELRQLVDRAIKLLNDTVALGQRYHSGGVPTAEHAATQWNLILAIKLLSGYVGMLANNGMEVRDCRLALINLKDVLTGNDFMTVNWKPWGHGDQRWRALTESTNTLTQSLDAQYFALYSS